jgi:hypothetical protein
MRGITMETCDKINILNLSLEDYIIGWFACMNSGLALQESWNVDRFMEVQGQGTITV